MTFKQAAEKRNKNFKIVFLLVVSFIGSILFINIK